MRLLGCWGGGGGAKGLELLSAEHALMENKRHPIVLLSAARHFYYNAMHSDPEVISQQRLECHLYLLKAPSLLKAQLSQLSNKKDGGNMLICSQEPSILSFLSFLLSSFSFSASLKTIALSDAPWETRHYF